MLTRHHAALAWTDRLGHPLTPRWNTAGWGYLRFHGGAANPWPGYGERTLRSWAERVTQTWPDVADVFVYFNNDPGGAAVCDAAAFASIIRRAGRAVTRTAIPGGPGPAEPAPRPGWGSPGDHFTAIMRNLAVRRGRAAGLRHGDQR